MSIITFATSPFPKVTRIKQLIEAPYMNIAVLATIYYYFTSTIIENKLSSQLNYSCAFSTKSFASFEGRGMTGQIAIIMIDATLKAIIYRSRLLEFISYYPLHHPLNYRDNLVL